MSNVLDQWLLVTSIWFPTQIICILLAAMIWVIADYLIPCKLADILGGVCVALLFINACLFILWMLSPFWLLCLNYILNYNW